jgi:hypothetical protein
MRPPSARGSRLTVIAQDPGVRDRRGQVLTASVPIPAEHLGPGPWGYRVQVVDYDTSRDRLYPALEHHVDGNGSLIDEFAEVAKVDPWRLIESNAFHAQNVYALVMRTLARFEQALGRRVSWGFGGHQLKVVPHAFADANAFYSRSDEALLFGYFEARDGNVIHTCLSHDVIVHETTHALLDGLRGRFIDPSSPDQAAFHEGFADVVSLLSVFSMPGVVEEILARDAVKQGKSDRLILRSDAVDPKNLKKSALLGLAEQMGDEVKEVRGEALRRSVELDPSPDYLKEPEFQVSHRRGEILVAAVMTAFVRAWSNRLEDLLAVSDGHLDLQRVAEEGRDAADYLLTMNIRALDYTPPVHLEFCDYLSAIITADVEIRPDESRYRFRDHLRSSFADFGMLPASGTLVPTPNGQKADPHTTAAQPSEPGAWVPCSTLALVYDRTHADPLTRDPDEVFRFIWENRGDLALADEAFSEVLSVRPSLRVGPDGFALRETVAELYQVLRLRPAELERRWKSVVLPKGLEEDDLIPLYGGATLIFDEYGRLKFYIHNALDNEARQVRRLEHLFARGALPERGARSRNFSRIHRLRGFDVGNPGEEW